MILKNTVFAFSYQILAASKVANMVDSKKATETILTHIELDLALYKIGHTKVITISFKQMNFKL